MFNGPQKQIYKASIIICKPQMLQFTVFNFENLEIGKLFFFEELIKKRNVTAIAVTLIEKYSK